MSMSPVSSRDQGNVILYVTVDKNYNEYQGREKDYTGTRRNVYVIADIYTTQSTKSTYPSRQEDHHFKPIG